MSIPNVSNFLAETTTGKYFISVVILQKVKCAEIIDLQKMDGIFRFYWKVISNRKSVPFLSSVLFLCHSLENTIKFDDRVIYEATY